MLCTYVNFIFGTCTKTTLKRVKTSVVKTQVSGYTPLVVTGRDNMSGLYSPHRCYAVPSTVTTTKTGYPLRGLSAADRLYCTFPVKTKRKCPLLFRMNEYRINQVLVYYNPPLIYYNFKNETKPKCTLLCFRNY
jgi:hypothetical protein